MSWQHRDNSCSQIECLIASGADDAMLDDYKTFDAEGNVGGKLKTIARQRKILPERVHENERRIEYLDYLTWQLEHTDA